MNIKEFNFSVGEVFEISKLKKYHFDAAVEIKTKLNEASYNSNFNELNKNYEKHKESIELISDYEQILFHQNVSKLQRECYNKHHNSVQNLKNKILIELDFKQRIKIGMSPRQIGQEYYEQESRSCLGK
jgi:3-hydroxy-3-methylglutaryl CoA synthase